MLLGKHSPVVHLILSQQKPATYPAALLHQQRLLNLLLFDNVADFACCSFACAAYRRNTNFIRVPTTVIGLIDASVSIKVAVNYGNYKNRLGAYHAPVHTFLDFTFLRSLPIAQVRNGFAELIKISSCSHLEVFNLLDKYCEQLIDFKFARADGSSDELRQAADIVSHLFVLLVSFCHTIRRSHLLFLNRSTVREFTRC